MPAPKRTEDQIARACTLRAEGHPYNSIVGRLMTPRRRDECRATLSA